MDDTQRQFRFYEKPPLYQLLISLVIIVGIGILLFSLLVLAGVYIFDADLSLVGDPSSAVDGKDLAFLRYILIVQGISVFIIPSIIILSLLRTGPGPIFFIGEFPQINQLLLVVVLAFCLFPITSFTGQLNSMIRLPEGLSGVEQWMVEKEHSIGDLIGLLINSDTLWVLILNLLMIALIPAIGEEMIFRGVFQKICYNLFKSDHMAVWVIAFFFSAIHLQFYGFLPRFILGLVFGYLFLWSRGLWLPIILHFVNNAVPVFSTYFNGLEKIKYEPDISLQKQLLFLSLPITVTIVILLYFRNNYLKQER